MLPQAEADGLIAMAKAFVGQGLSVFAPAPGLDETHELESAAGEERFLLDLSRGTIKLSKIKLQTRYNKVIGLVRLEIDGPPHTNPDGQIVAGTHIHIYREGYDLKWAVPLDPTRFSNPSSHQQVYDDFLAYCNIAKPPSSTLL